MTVVVMVVRVIVTAAAVIVLVLMAMIVAAFRVIVVMVVMIVTAAAFFVGVIVFVRMIVVVVRVIVTFTADVLGIHREQIEQSEYAQPDAGGEHHGAENAIRRQVGRDAPSDVEEEHHTAPDEERGDAEEVNECACAAHKK
jgi:hypothetical protein